MLEAKKNKKITYLMIQYRYRVIHLADLKTPEQPNKSFVKYLFISGKVCLLRSMDHLTIEERLKIVKTRVFFAANFRALQAHGSAV